MRERQQLNWITTINSLYAYTASQPLSPRAIALYHFLLYTFSRSRWPEWASIRADALAAGCNMSTTSVKRARDEIAKAGLIDWTPQGANHPAKYRLREPSLWWTGETPEEREEMRRRIRADLERPIRPIYA